MKEPSAAGNNHREVRILVVEDVEADAELLERELLRAGLRFSARRVSCEEEFRKDLEEFKPDLILSDYTLPGFDGRAALAIARQKHPELPFIYVSGSIGEERAIAALRDGATDYVIKDRLTRLGPAIERALREAKRAREHRRLEEELLQSDKLAAVGQLIGGVAHELNNPLTSILGHVQLLMMETPQQTQLHQDLAVILRESLRCSRLIKSLLAFARKHEHQLRDSDLNALASEILELKTYDLRRAQITLVQDLAPELPPVFVDPHQIQQVLLNLLNNAEQAMEKAKGTIRVETRRSGEEVLLAVSDTGPGIAPENLELIFEPFFTTKEPGKGTGLGLSICSKIIKDHGGSLGVESRPGEGARFTLRLPALGAPKAQAPEAPRPAKVLLIDDHPEVLAFVARALRHSGREVHAFVKPEEALSALYSSTFDLVISDFCMPGMDGSDFYRKAVALRPGLSGRFLILTGQAYLEAAKPFCDSAHLPVLIKPFDLEEFERTLRSLEAAPAAMEGGAP